MNELLTEIWQSILQEKIRHAASGSSMVTGAGMPSSDPLLDTLKVVAVVLGIVLSCYLIKKTRGDIRSAKVSTEREQLEIQLLHKQLED